MPTKYATSLASLVKLPCKGFGTFTLFDPCAGQGSMITAIREEAASGQRALSSLFRIVACEAEDRHHRWLRKALNKSDMALNGDAFRMSWQNGTGASLMYLDPPAGPDVDFGRLEARWLHRFTRALMPGGALIAVIAHQALPAMANTLARHYGTLRLVRLPDADFSRAGQIVIWGTRVHPAVPASKDRLASLRAIAAEPLRLKVLGESPHAYVVAPSSAGTTKAIFSPTLRSIDMMALRAAWKPLRRVGLATELDASSLVGAKWPTAMAPRAAHLAMALVAGHFNGRALVPDECEGTPPPPVMIKGVYQRDAIPVTSKRKKVKDEVLEVVTCVERARLSMRILSLDTYEVFDPELVTEPTGSRDPRKMNVADIFTFYSKALAALMADQFPPIHQAGHPRIPTPDAFERTLFRAQQQAYEGALKVVSRGRQPKLLSEVGTGKTSMSVAIACALHPNHVRDTIAGLRRSPGFEAATLPAIRRTLIICPPHVVPVWEEEIQACWPAARVVPIENGMVDLRREAEFYVLGREQAKLGAGIAGLASCPKCGAPAGDPATNASKRSSCESPTRREPLNVWARLLADVLPAVGLDYRLRVATGLDGLGREQSRTAAVHGEVLHRARPDRPPRLGDAERARAKIGRLVADSLTRSMLALEKLVAAGDEKSILKYLGPANDVLKAAGAAGHLTDYAAGIGWGASSAADRDGKAAVEHMRVLASGFRHAKSLPALNFGRLLGDPGARRNEPNDGLEALLSVIALAASWTTSAVCGEPLWSMTSHPRRYPLATSICRRLPGKFDLLIVDEAHEAANEDSSQSKAIHRLAGAITHTMLLTGSIMGGYASSLFTNWWSIDREFRVDHPRGSHLDFCKRYGFRKLEIASHHVPPGQDGKRFGPIEDSVIREFGKQAGEAPGILPVFVLRHLLATACVVHKADLDVELPKLTEGIAPLDDLITSPSDHELIAEYQRIEEALRSQIAADAFTPLAMKLFGALSRLPSYLDMCCLGPFEFRYPESVGGEIVVTGLAFPSEWRTPKERWLLHHLAKLPAGERAVLCLRNSRSGLGPRLAKMVRAVLGWRVAILDSQKIAPRDRQQWIRDQVSMGCRLLIVNPNAVRTGINSMTTFNHGIWYELDLSSNTVRQFGGRLHRTGQKLPVSIVVPYYSGTVQDDLKNLIARKVTASEQVDGLTVQGALEAAGAGEDEVAAAEAAMAMGQAIYERLAARSRAARR